MANKKHLEKLKEGVGVWNDWRAEQKSYGKYLSVDLREADLREANLEGANLRGTNLNGAALSGADLNRADLSLADLANVDLRVATLRETKLRNANLMWANLSESYLGLADLGKATLGGAKLCEADLSLADLSEAYLHDADLSGANLHEANLSRSQLTRVQFGDAELSYTSLLGVDLSSLAASNVSHQGPSHVDWRTVSMSIESPNLHQFLVDTGMPETFATYMIDCAKSIDPEILFSLLHSTFISYGGLDEAFAIRLQEALQRNGVKTFIFTKHATLGEPLHDVMYNEISNHDRVILICTKSSLNRPGVLNEIEESLRRESREGGQHLLIPIALDDYIFTEWNPPKESTKQAILDRVIGYFHGADTDDTKFQEGLLRLIDALKLPVSSY